MTKAAAKHHIPNILSSIVDSTPCQFNDDAFTSTVGKLAAEIAIPAWKLKQYLADSGFFPVTVNSALNQRDIRTREISDLLEFVRSPKEKTPEQIAEKAGKAQVDVEVLEVLLEQNGYAPCDILSTLTHLDQAPSLTLEAIAN